MSILVANEHYDFNSLKELLQVTDGNLASNLKSLEKEGYITVEKSFINRKPHTKYRKTEKGQKAFENHLMALENLIKQQYKLIFLTNNFENQSTFKQCYYGDFKSQCTRSRFSKHLRPIDKFVGFEDGCYFLSYLVYVDTDVMDL